MAKSLTEFQENTNNWRESINTSKSPRKTETKKWMKPINSINEEIINQVLKETNY